MTLKDPELQKSDRIGAYPWRSRHLDVRVRLIGHDVGWCRWCRTATPAMRRTQLSFWRPPSGGHGKRAWRDESSRRQRPDCFLGALGGQRQPSGRSGHRSCFGKWESSIRHTCPNHQRRFHWKHFPMVGWSMQPLPRASSTQKRTTKWWWLQHCRPSSLSSNLCCIASRHTPWVWQRHQMLCLFDIPPPRKM